MSSSSGGVTIHKRPRPNSNASVSSPSAHDLFSNAAAKKRKFKIVPNQPSLSSFRNQLLNNGSQFESTKPNTKEDESVLITDDEDEPEVPEDRVELLKLV